MRAGGLMKRTQFCSVGSEYVARPVVSGPFDINCISIVLNVAIVRAEDDTPRTRSVVDTRTGWRVGKIPSARGKATYWVHAKRLLADRVQQYGYAEVKRRIISAKSIPDLYAQQCRCMLGPQLPEEKKS
jgi:hypothetical protein